MNVLIAELLKLHRSAVWVVVVILPLLSVITGTVNYVMNAGVLSPSWDSYWSQVTLFYGLLFCSVGIAILASTLWRMEHRGNWPRLMAGPTTSWAIVGAKLAALGVLVAAMQGVLLVVAWGAGVIFAKMPAVLPGRFVIGAAVAVLAGLAVASWQSLLSMLVRSFAAPVAVAVLGCVVAIGLLMGGAPAWLNVAVPYGLLTQALSLGGSALADAAALSWTSVARLALPAVGLALGGAALAGAILERREIRA